MISERAMNVNDGQIGTSHWPKGFSIHRYLVDSLVTIAGGW